MTVLQTAQAIIDTDELLNNPDLTHDAHRRLENRLNNLGCDHGVEVSRALIRAVSELREVQRVMEAMSTSAAHAVSWVKPRSSACENHAKAISAFLAEINKETT